MIKTQKRKCKEKRIIEHVTHMTEAEYRKLLSLLAEYCSIDQIESVKVVIGHF